MFPKDLDNVTIWALNYNTSDIRRKYIADSIKKEGLSRFGWSWMAHHDLTNLRRKMEKGQISKEDQKMYNRCNFLFDIRLAIGWYMSMSPTKASALPCRLLAQSTATTVSTALIQRSLKPERMVKMTTGL